MRSEATDKADERAPSSALRSMAALGDHRGLYWRDAWSFGLADERCAHRLEEEQGHEARNDVERRSCNKHGVPTPRHRLHDTGVGHDQGRRSLSRVEQAGVRRGVFGPERVATGRGEQTVD